MGVIHTSVVFESPVQSSLLNLRPIHNVSHMTAWYSKLVLRDDEVTEVNKDAKCQVGYLSTQH